MTLPTPWASLGRNGSGRRPDAGRTRAAQWNSKKRTPTGRGQGRFTLSRRARGAAPAPSRARREALPPPRPAMWSGGSARHFAARPFGRLRIFKGCAKHAKRRGRGGEGLCASWVHPNCMCPNGVGKMFGSTACTAVHRNAAPKSASPNNANLISDCDTRRGGELSAFVSPTADDGKTRTAREARSVGRKLRGKLGARNTVTKSSFTRSLSPIVCMKIENVKTRFF
eukprot:gene11686-biopygen1850